jgi:hypothetical protein
MKYCERQQAWIAEEKKPPCGKDKECAGASKGFRCGAHRVPAESRGEDPAEDERRRRFDAALEENAASFQVGKFWRAVG